MPVVKIQRNCLICLKRFRKLNNDEIPHTHSHALQHRIQLPYTRPSEETSGGEEATASDLSSSSTKESDIYVRLLLFASRYLKMKATTESLLEDARQHKRCGGTDLDAFCDSCRGLISYVCDLYDELQVVKLHLVWKLSQLGEKLKSSRKAVPFKLTHGVMKCIAEQLNILTISKMKRFREALQICCSDKVKNSPPKMIVPRGLFPEKWRYTYSATKTTLIRLIVVFLLASASMKDKESGKTAIEDGSKGFDKKQRRRKGRGDRTKIGYADLKHGVLDSELNETKRIKREFVDALGDKEVGISDEGEDGDTRLMNDNDGDSDWSRGAASPVSVASAGSDVDFNPDDNRSKYRWNLRKRRRGNRNATKTEPGNADGWSAEENEDDWKLANNTKVKRRYVKKEDKKKAPTVEDRPRNVHCPKCSKSFLDPRGLSRHLKFIHRLHIDYSCMVCGLKFKRRQDMDEHKKKAHSRRTSNVFTRLRQSGSSTKCTRCNMEFPSKTKMMQHRRLVHRHSRCHKKFECPVCFRLLLTEEQFEWHFAGHQNQNVASNHKKSCVNNVNLNSKVVYCLVCGMRFDKQTSLTEHMVEEHQSSFPCNSCDVRFANATFLMEHLEIHEKHDKLHQCTFCSLSFSTHQYYVLHLKVSHTDATTMRCDHLECTEEFEAVQELNEHLKIHLKESSTANKWEEKAQAPGEIESGGKQEEKQDNSDNNVDSKPIFYCPTCNWGFLTKYDLSLHQLVHLPRQESGPDYWCPKCELNFRFLNSLITHYNSAHWDLGEKTPKKRCSTCEKEYFSTIYFKAHLRAHQEDRKDSGEKFICDVCAKECDDSVCLRVHQQTHEKKTDEMVQSKPLGRPPGFPSSRVRGKKGIKRFTRTWSKQCRICEEKFESLVMLLEHLEKAHETENKHVHCWFCYRTFSLKQTLEIHYWSKHKACMFRCEDFSCNKKFYTIEDLNEHLKGHLSEMEAAEKKQENKLSSSKESVEGTRVEGKHGDAQTTTPAEIQTVSEYGTKTIVNQDMEQTRKILYCSKCNWGFLNRDQLELHEILHLEMVNGYVHCPKCGDFFMTIGLLQYHYNKDHGKFTLPYSCAESGCGAKYSSKHRLDIHMDRHKRRKEMDPDVNLVCADCGFSALDPILLEKHRKVHDPTSFMSCSVEGCNENFCSKRRLLRHLKTDHNVGSQHPCPICEATFLERADVKAHVRAVHCERSFVCDVCGKGFKRVHVLRHHRTVAHNPDRTAEYICSECGMAYKSHSGLQFHIGSVHTPESERKYGCPHCPKRYHSLMLINMHIKTCSKLNGVGLPNQSSKETDNMRMSNSDKPRKSRGRPKKMLEVLENDKSCTSDEEEKEGQMDTGGEKYKVSAPPTSNASSINAIITNLTGISQQPDVDISDGVRNSMSMNDIQTSQRISKRKRGGKDLPASSMPKYNDEDESASQNTSTTSTVITTPTFGSSGAGGAFQSTLDHMLLQSMMQQQSLCSTASLSSSYSQQWSSMASTSSLKSHPNQAPFQSPPFHFLHQQQPLDQHQQHRLNNYNQQQLQNQVYSPNHGFSSPEQPENLRKYD